MGPSGGTWAQVSDVDMWALVSDVDMWAQVSDVDMWLVVVCSDILGHVGACGNMWPVVLRGDNSGTCGMWLYPYAASSPV